VNKAFESVTLATCKRRSYIYVMIAF